MRESQSPNYCFYFPYHEDSGVPVLFHRMANYLALKYPESIISVIDYENGAIARSLLNLSNQIHYCFVDGKNITPPHDAILIMQADVPYYWPSELKPLDSTKIFFWNLHPRNLIPSLLPVPLLREQPFENYGTYKLLANLYPNTLKRLKAYVLLLIKNNALAFMDKPNVTYTNKYLFIEHLPANYLPVPIAEAKRGVINKSVVNKNSYCWIGRICDFKVHILIYTCKMLFQFAEKELVNIDFLIVGDGPFLSLAKENILSSKYFKVTFCGAIPHNDLNNFLIEKARAVFSMGTSALESAILKIPTILVDFSYSKIKIKYKFRWLHETVDYDLGHQISDDDEDKGNSLADILYKLDVAYDEEAIMAYNYVINNHLLIDVAQQFVLLSKMSTLEYGMIDEECFKKPTLLKLYNKIRGVKN